MVRYSLKKTTLPDISVFHPYFAHALSLLLVLTIGTRTVLLPEQFLLIRVLFFIVRIFDRIITFKSRLSQLNTFATTPFRCITLKKWM